PSSRSSRAASAKEYGGITWRASSAGTWRGYGRERTETPRDPARSDGSIGGEPEWMGQRGARIGGSAASVCRLGVRCAGGDRLRCLVLVRRSAGGGLERAHGDRLDRRG